VTRSYIVSSDAAADICEITRYSIEQWGHEKCRSYIANLEKCADAAAKGVGVYKDMSALYPNLRMIKCQHHHVFCLYRQGAPALVVAILHERMDIMARLESRLTV
jgi:plasmid stabilization system protein ParE